MGALLPRSAPRSSPAACVAILVTAALLPRGVRGHGSLVVPPPRNSVDRSLPDWAGGKHTPSSPNAPGMPTIEPFGCDCVNGTGPCESAQSCFWFSNGCTIGCGHCTGNGSRAFNNDICGGKLNATVVDPRHRTLNRKAKANTPADVYRYNPWRRPGNAPSFDPCGMAGGQWTPAIAGAEYRSTKFAKMGDLGSKVLKRLPTGVVWERGGLADVSFYIKSNHGGGYQYRLCPLHEELTEACFQRTPVPFASQIQVLKFKDHEEKITGTFVSEGTTPPGSVWAMNPIPMCGQETTHTADPSGNVHTCPAGTPANWTNFKYPAPGTSNITSFTIGDSLRIPHTVEPGEYVFQWRWDAEQTPQVWGACAVSYCLFLFFCLFRI